MTPTFGRTFYYVGPVVITRIWCDKISEKNVLELKKQHDDIISVIFLDDGISASMILLS